MNTQPLKIESLQLAFKALIFEHLIDHRAKLFGRVCFLLGSPLEHPWIGERIPKGQSQAGDILFVGSSDGCWILKLWGGQDHQAHLLDTDFDRRIGFEVCIDETSFILVAQRATQGCGNPQATPFFHLLDVARFIGFLGHPTFRVARQLISYLDRRSDQRLEPLSRNTRPAFITDACVVRGECRRGQRNLWCPSRREESFWNGLCNSCGWLPSQTQLGLGLLVPRCI